MRASRLRAGAASVTGAVVAALALAACSGDDSAAGAGTQINWFVATQPGGTIEDVAERCTKEANGDYSVKVELLPTDASQQREQLVRRLGAEDSSIDVIGMDVIWTAEFANAGWLREWSGPDAEQVTENVFSSVVESATFEDKLYGAPFNSNTQLLWYRTDLVGQAPKTWDQMIAEAERIGGREGKVQVQANFYEGYAVWVTTMLASAGATILEGQDDIALEQAPTEKALAVIGKLGNSSAAPANLSTSDEDTARLGFEAGSAFMVNYTFAYASAKENAPQVFKNMGAAKLPEVVPGTPSAPPLGGFNLGVSAFSDNPDLAFEAAKCLSNADSQLTATKLDGLPPTREDLYETKVVRDAFPTFSEDIRRSIAAAEPRPRTPAYTDLSLAIQRALHPPEDIDPQNPTPAYERLRDALEDAVKREGLL